MTGFSPFALEGVPHAGQRCAENWKLMVLLDDVVEVLHLSNDDWSFASGIDLINGRLVGATLVQGDLLRKIVGLHGFVEEAHGCGLVALGRQQEIDRFALFVHDTVEIFSGAFEHDVGLVHSPAAAHWALGFAKDFFKLW